MRKSNADLFRAEQVWADIEQAQLVGAAYEGTPTQEKSLVYVHGGKEYLVPVVNTWAEASIIKSIVRLDRAERVISRPNGTSCISEMKRTRKISVDAKKALIKGVHAWFLPEKGCTVQIVPFDEDERERA
jgi:hypothetical protein